MMYRTSKFIRNCQYLIDNDELEYVHENFIELYKKSMESEEFLNTFVNERIKEEDNIQKQDNDSIEEKFKYLFDNIRDKFDIIQTKLVQISNSPDMTILNKIDCINSKIEQQNQLMNNLEIFQGMFKQATKLIPSSSPELGIQGETEMIKLLQELFPKNEILNATETNHSGDIIMVDNKTNIKYIFEIKNKQSITANDITKFVSDVKNMNDEIYKTYGIFISLNTDNIPKKGSYSFEKENNLIYLGKKYVSKEVLSIIIKQLIPIKENITKTSDTIIKHTYEIDKEKLELILNIKKQSSEMKNIYETICKEIEINGESRKNLMNIKESVESYMIRLKDLSDTLTLNDAETDIQKQNEIKQMKEYIRRNKRSFKKEDLKKEFPLCLSIIVEKKVDELRKWAEL